MKSLFGLFGNRAFFHGVPGSYTWKRLGKPLNMEKTLAENGMEESGIIWPSWGHDMWNSRNSHMHPISIASNGFVPLNVGVLYPAEEHARVRYSKMWCEWCEWCEWCVNMSRQMSSCHVAGWDRRVLALVHWSGSPHPSDPLAFQRRLDWGTETHRIHCCSWWSHSWSHSWSHLELLILLSSRGSKFTLIPESCSRNVVKDPKMDVDGVREVPNQETKKILWRHKWHNSVCVFFF